MRAADRSRPRKATAAAWPVPATVPAGGGAAGDRVPVVGVESSGRLDPVGSLEVFGWAALFGARAAGDRTGEAPPAPDDERASGSTAAEPPTVVDVSVDVPVAVSSVVAVPEVAVLELVAEPASARVPEDRAGDPGDVAVGVELGVSGACAAPGVATTR